MWFPDFYDATGDEVFDDGTVFESFGDTSDGYAEAREVCNSCAIRQECLDYAMDERIRYGMFGGLTPIERRRIERRDRRRRLQERRRLESTGQADDFDDTVDDDDIL